MSRVYRLVLRHATSRAQPLHSSPAYQQDNYGKNITTARSLTNGVANDLDPGQVGIATPLRRLLVPSPAQQKVVDLSRTQNVVVCACPGAGKTATAEAIVAANFDQSVAVVTYSKRLQLETAGRFENYPTADVFTFHGMASRLFSTVVFNDIVLHNLRKVGTVPAWTGDPYDIIVLDEFQDCTDDLFWLTCAFLSSITNRAGGRAPRVVILGDGRQAIYGFRGADSRYLALSPELFSSLSPYSWNTVTLSNSFRLSHQTSTFVNEYVHAELFDVNSLAKFLMPLIKKYGPERTAILAPFVRRNEVLSKLTNRLSKTYGIKIAVSTSDDVPLDKLVYSGKLIVSTYHQFKGNERDLVIVYGADNAYFEILGRNLPNDTCPNEIFVALTRARKQLVVMHDAREAAMPFVCPQTLYNTADVVRMSSAKFKRCRASGRQINTGLLLPRNVIVSEIARHVLQATLDDVCNRYLQITELAALLPEELQIKAPERVLTDSVKMHYEAVSDINGMAVVAAYEHDIKGTLSTLGHEKEDSPGTVPTEKGAQAAWFCREACRHDALSSGYYSRWIQMARHSFDWLGPHLDSAKQRLREQFNDSPKLKFEHKLGEEGFSIYDGEKKTTRIRGRADIIQYTKTSDRSLPIRLHNATRPIREDGFGGLPGLAEEVTIWEIKFVSKLSLEHAVQASVYGYLWAVQNNTERLPRILLFNVHNGEKWEITALGGRDAMRCLVEEVLRAKYSTDEEMPTNKFLKMCTETMEEAVYRLLWGGGSTADIISRAHKAG
ncbi:P-loop containing nucleoside triphosphate hydrolase protein [Daldinia sp. FL1419]|nr:P-loop containing nucleoside triphosphate hydrolase protein [Daldinia sp. FL1419]